MITELVEIFSALELQSLLPRARRTGVIEIDLYFACAGKASFGGTGWCGSSLTIAFWTHWLRLSKLAVPFFKKQDLSFLTCGPPQAFRIP